MHEEYKFDRTLVLSQLRKCCMKPLAAKKMKKATVAAMLFLAIGWSISSTNAFVPNKKIAFCALSAKKCLSGKTTKDGLLISHRTMTEEAIRQVADLFKANPEYCDHKISKWSWAFTKAIDAITEANANVDLKNEEKKLAAAHFDAEQFESGQNRLIDLRGKIVESIKEQKYKEARKMTGRMFHTLQDFYSHSNWIENGNLEPNPVLGKSGESIKNVASLDTKTCSDCQLIKTKLGGNYYKCSNNIIVTDGTLTSGYTMNTKNEEGTKIVKPEGKCSHGGPLDETRDTSAKGGINKDSPYEVFSPHYTLHTKAATAAQQATIDMLGNLRNDVKDDIKFGRYLGVYKIKPSAERSAGSLMRSHINRNAMLQHHWNRIEGI